MQRKHERVAMKHNQTRRHFLQTTLGGAAELGFIKSSSASTSQQSSESPTDVAATLGNSEVAIIRKPAWMRAGIIAASAMEPLTFIIRRGGQAINETELWHAERSEAA